MNKLFAERDYSAQVHTSYLLLGSHVNAMKFIFEEKKYFYRQVEGVPVSPVEERDIIDYIVKGFMVSGKVMDKNLVLGACKLFRNDMWYLNHFVSICDTLTRGYINEAVLMEALRTLISIHEPHFQAIVDDLTDHQLSLVKAVLDGVVRFSATLKKKEVLTFNEKEEPEILDPLFEYWLEKYFFEK